MLSYPAREEHGYQGPLTPEPAPAGSYSESKRPQSHPNCRSQPNLSPRRPDSPPVKRNTTEPTHSARKLSHSYPNSSSASSGRQPLAAMTGPQRKMTANNLLHHPAPQIREATYMPYPAPYPGTMPLARWYGGQGHTASEATLGTSGHLENTGRARRAFVPD